MSLELETSDTDRPPPGPRFGLVEDPEDCAYDGPADELYTSANPPLSYEQPTGPVLTQYDSDCVANAFADAIRDRQAMQGVEVPRLPSRRWLYWYARHFAGRLAFDEGSQPALCIRAIRELGIPSEVHGPYVGSPFDPPSLEAVQHAYDQRGKVSCRVVDPGDIRQAVSSDLGIVLAIRVDQALLDWTAMRAPWVYRGPLKGLHALRIVGYDHVHGARLKNSWGESWGDGGFAWMDEGALFSETVRGIWAIDWAPSYSEDIPAEVRS